LEHGKALQMTVRRLPSGMRQDRVTTSIQEVATHGSWPQERSKLRNGC
jgi:hypothetical protein